MTAATNGRAQQPQPHWVRAARLTPHANTPTHTTQPGRQDARTPGLSPPLEHLQGEVKKRYFIYTWEKGLEFTSPSPNLTVPRFRAKKGVDFAASRVPFLLDVEQSAFFGGSGFGKVASS